MSPPLHDPEHEAQDGQYDGDRHAPDDQVEDVRPGGVVDDGLFEHLPCNLPSILVLGIASPCHLDDRHLFLDNRK